MSLTQCPWPTKVSPCHRLVLLTAALALAGHTLGVAVPSNAKADGLMLVPAGAIWMGRDDGPPEEAPLHRVFVRDFWIDRHKVTNAEFATFLRAQGLISAERERRYDEADQDARIHQGIPDSGFERHPAVEVSWFGARDYCRWRGRRLPTEAEWEKAARGDDKRPYPWGWEPPTPERAIFGRRWNATAPADGRPASRSPYGVEDLLGNLREWTATVLRPYPYRHDDGREKFTGEGQVVVRGASHDDPAQALSVTTRRSYDRRGAAAGHHHVGFRCATSEDLGGY
jgi:formylglycine-generating enzyme required for sulfatase activity